MSRAMNYCGVVPLWTVVFVAGPLEWWRYIVVLVSIVLLAAFAYVEGYEKCIEERP